MAKTRTSRRLSTRNIWFILLGLLLISAVIVVPIVIVQQTRGTLETFKSQSSANTLTPTGTNEIVVALFYADWCPHCVEFKPHFEAVQKTVTKTSKGTTLRYELIDAVADPKLAKENDIGGYPTVKVFKSGKPATEYNGDRTESAFTAFVKGL